MPQKQCVFYERYNGDLRTMRSCLEGLDISTVKVVGVYPENPVKNNLPTIVATLFVIDPKSGAPTAIMGCSWITNMGTGPAGSVAARHLAIGAPNTAGLVARASQDAASCNSDCLWETGRG